MAPEVFKQEEYDTKVDVFSFALILQEVTIFVPSSMLIKATHYKIFMAIVIVALVHLFCCIHILYETFLDYQLNWPTLFFLENQLCRILITF